MEPGARLEHPKAINYVEDKRAPRAARCVAMRPILAVCLMAVAEGFTAPAPARASRRRPVAVAALPGAGAALAATASVSASPLLALSAEEIASTASVSASPLLALSAEESGLPDPMIAVVFFAFLFAAFARAARASIRARWGDADGRYRPRRRRAP